MLLNHSWMYSRILTPRCPVWLSLKASDKMHIYSFKKNTYMLQVYSIKPTLAIPNWANMADFGWNNIGADCGIGIKYILYSLIKFLLSGFWFWSIFFSIILSSVVLFLMGRWKMVTDWDVNHIIWSLGFPLHCHCTYSSMKKIRCDGWWPWQDTKASLSSR